MDATDTTCTASRYNRRLFQYSVRTLLVFTLMVSVALSWLAVKMLQARKQTEAVQAIRQLGASSRPLLWGSGSVTYEHELTPGGSTRGPEILRNVLGNDFFAKVTKVTLSGPRTTDAELEHLRALPPLKTLYLIDTQITGAGMRQLNELGELECLVLQGQQVSDAGLEDIKGMTRLRRLDLCGDRITDAGMRVLETLVSLEELDLSQSRITGMGLRHLRGLQQLRTLTLDITRLTNVGVDHLQALPQLQEIYVFADRNDVARERLPGLQQALPKCKLFGLGTPRSHD